MGWGVSISDINRAAPDPLGSPTQDKGRQCLVGEGQLCPSAQPCPHSPLGPHRWSCPLRSTWTATCWLCQTTCSCTTTRSTGGGRAASTRQKVRPLLIWTMVGTAHTRVPLPPLPCPALPCPAWPSCWACSHGGDPEPRLGLAPSPILAAPHLLDLGFPGSPLGFPLLGAFRVQCVDLVGV